MNSLNIIVMLMNSIMQRSLSMIMTVRSRRMHVLGMPNLVNREPTICFMCNLAVPLVGFKCLQTSIEETVSDDIDPF